MKVIFSLVKAEPKVLPVLTFTSCHLCPWKSGEFQTEDFSYKITEPSTHGNIGMYGETQLTGTIEVPLGSQGQLYL